MSPLLQAYTSVGSCGIIYEACKAACRQAPGQREIFQRPLEALVATWQHMPIPLCAQASPHIPHQVYHLHATLRIAAGLPLELRYAHITA